MQKETLDVRLPQVRIDEETMRLLRQKMAGGVSREVSDHVRAALELYVERSGVILDTDTVLQLQMTAAEMGLQVGRPLSMSEVISRLVAAWRQAHPSEIGAMIAPQRRRTTGNALLQPA